VEKWEKLGARRWGEMVPFLALGGIDCPPTQCGTNDTAGHSCSLLNPALKFRAKNWQFKRKAVNCERKRW